MRVDMLAAFLVLVGALVSFTSAKTPDVTTTVVTAPAVNLTTTPVKQKRPVRPSPLDIPANGTRLVLHSREADWNNFVPMQMQAASNNSQLQKSNSSESVIQATTFRPAIQIVVASEVPEKAENRAGSRSYLAPPTNSGSNPPAYGAAPSYQSSGPVYQPPAPAYQPAAPTYQPAASAYQPAASAYQPAAPAYQPAAPTYQPAAPAYQPAAPAYQPAAPSNQPVAPAYQPSASAYRLPTSAIKPQAPAYKPPTPVYQQPPAAYKPPTPAYPSPSPAYKPQGPAPNAPAYGAVKEPIAPSVVYGSEKSQKHPVFQKKNKKAKKPAQESANVPVAAVSSYSAPPAPTYGAPPAPSYGAPPAPSYGEATAPSYGPPPAPSYGAPQAQSYGAPPAPSYEVPQDTSYIYYPVKEEGMDDVKNGIEGAKSKIWAMISSGISWIKGDKPDVSDDDAVGYYKDGVWDIFVPLIVIGVVLPVVFGAIAAGTLTFTVPTWVRALANYLNSIFPIKINMGGRSFDTNFNSETELIELEHVFHKYANTLYSDDCIEKISCELGDSLKDFKNKSWVIWLVEHIVPKKYSRAKAAFIKTSQGDWTLNSCSLFKCDSQKLKVL